MIRAVLRDAAIYTLPTLLTRGLSVIMLPIYARALSPTDYGVLDLITTTGTILNVLLCLEVAQGLVRLRVDVDDPTRRRMTGTAWLFSSAMYVFFIAVMIPLAPLIADQFLGTVEWTDAVRVGAFSIALSSLVNLFLGQFRWELRSRTYTTVTSAYAMSSLALSAWIALGLERGIVGIMVGQSMAAAVTSAVTLYMVRASWVLRFNWRDLTRMLRFSWPLVPASLSVFTSLYFNRMALASLADLKEVGIYGMGARMSSVATLLIAGMQGAVTPLVYAHYKEESTPRNLAQLFNIAVAASMMTGLGLHLVSRELVLVLSTPTYASSAALVPILVPAMLLSQIYVFAPGMAIAQKTLHQLAVTAAGAAVSIAANVALVPIWGAMGAALATLASSTVFLGAWILVSQRHYAIPYHRASLALSLGSYLLFSAVAQAGLGSHSQPLPDAALRIAIFASFTLSLVATRLVPLSAIRSLSTRSGLFGARHSR